jgi:hypothetical protein
MILGAFLYAFTQQSLIFFQKPRGHRDIQLLPTEGYLEIIGDNAEMLTNKVRINQNIGQYYPVSFKPFLVKVLISEYMYTFEISRSKNPNDTKVLLEKYGEIALIHDKHCELLLNPAITQLAHEMATHATPKDKLDVDGIYASGFRILDICQAPHEKTNE